jgi:hypothetical protein
MGLEHMPKTTTNPNSDHYLTLYTSIKSQWNTNLNVKSKTKTSRSKQGVWGCSMAKALVWVPEPRKKNKSLKGSIRISFCDFKSGKGKPEYINDSTNNPISNKAKDLNSNFKDMSYVAVYKT